MTDFLTRKYADRPAVSILRADAADASFTAELIGGPVDYVSAIGVMFHIVDDDRWRSAIRNLAGVLRPGGLMIVGGDFGAETRNVNFHGSDEFSTWREYATARAAAEEIRINKRVRSLAEWSMTAASCGLRVVDLVRTDRDSRLTTPENDILLLERADGA
jgi:cyclopropane fatty-acyl-phospholipid synthase-like methyltransferase